jgi:uncharacterized protein YidB (DUF937 family)
MGWLDEIKGRLLVLLGSSAEGEGGTGAAVSQVVEAVQKHGLGNLLERLRAAGLGEAVASWVGNGPNRPVAGPQLGDALGPEMVERLAARLGLPPGQAAELLSKVLPHVVDMLTPEGRVEDGAAAHESEIKPIPAAGSGETET